MQRLPNITRITAAALALSLLCALGVVRAPAAQAATHDCVFTGGARPTASISSRPRLAHPARGAVVASAHVDDPLLSLQPELFTGCWSFDLPAAWQFTTGAKTIVAVIDSGADLTHPDLQGAIWTNTAEVPGNGIDDDQNGYTDDVHGIDLVTRGVAIIDPYGHGTAVAGLIAARAGNGEGISGVAPKALIMPVRVVGADGSGSIDALAEGIRYAVANGATIINVSLNSDTLTPGLRDALAQAARADVLVVASAGNSGRDIDVAPSYPAASSEANVLSVAALSRSGTLAAYSARGRVSVDTAIIGEGLPTTASGGGYATFSGTSAAAAIASGVAALTRSVAPGLSAAATRQLMMVTGGEHNLALAGGAMRPGTAVRRALHPVNAPAVLEVQAALRARGRVVIVSLRGPRADTSTVLLTLRTSRSTTIRRAVILRNGDATVRVALPARATRATVTAQLSDAGGFRVAQARTTAR